VLAFQPIVEIISTRYRDPSWRCDLIQGGNVGLLNAIGKFPPSADRNKFLSYARKAIKNAMTDYVRKELEKRENLILISTYSTDPPQTVDHFDNRLTHFDHYTTTSWPVTVTYHLDSSNPRRIGLTEREARIWDLWEKGYKQVEIAQIFHLSSSYTSKIINGIKAKLQRLYK
jgi:RNA polymerase sigma factor (sigma-70 family)